MICPKCRKKFKYYNLVINEKLNIRKGFPCPFCHTDLVVKNQGSLKKISSLVIPVVYLVIFLISITIGKKYNDASLWNVVMYSGIVIFGFFILMRVLNNLPLKIKENNDIQKEGYKGNNVNIKKPGFKNYFIFIIGITILVLISLVYIIFLLSNRNL